jgi:hypothetical protein
VGFLLLRTKQSSSARRFPRRQGEQNDRITHLPSSFIGFPASDDDTTSLILAGEAALGRGQCEVDLMSAPSVGPRESSWIAWSRMTV